MSDALRMPMLVLAGVVSFTACSGGDDGPPTELDAVYKVTSWTRNSDGCTTEGDSVADFHSSYLFLELADLFDQQLLQMVSCIDVVECQSEAATDTVYLDWIFTEGNDAEGWIGSGSFLSSAATGPCAGMMSSYMLTTDGDHGILLTAEHRQVGDVPRDEEGFCDIEAAVAMVEDQPCDELEVMQAGHEADL